MTGEKPVNGSREPKAGKVKGSGAGKGKIAASLEEWEEKVRQPSLVSKPERKRQFKTLSDYPVKPLYTPLDLEGIDYQRDIGFPGQFPFTRGQMPNGYRSHDFSLSFYSGFGTSASANKRFQELVARGAKDVHAAADLPTQIGLDSDDPRAEGEVGKVGVAIASLSDAERLYDGIDITQVEMGFGVCNCVSPYALSLILAVAERRGVAPTDLPRINQQNDPLKEYTGRDTYVFPVPIAVELATDVREYMLRSLREKRPGQIAPGFVCTTQLSWCGVGAAQELGFALAHFVTYIDSALRRGLSLEEFVPRMDWHAGCDLDIFQEAAKFRAGRRLFARLIKERYHCDDPRVQGLCTTAWISSQRMTAQQPLNNLCRITMEVLAGILGGLERIATPGYDEALALPTEESTRIANMAKFIILHECGLENTIDPMAGSYYLEKLTSQIEEEGQYWFDRIEEMGGAVGAIEQGFHYREELKGMYRDRQEIASGERVVIGINRFRIDDDKPPEIFQVDPEDERRQIEQLKQFRGERDKTLVREKLERLEEVVVRKASDNRVNIVPATLEAVKAYATNGEIHGIMRKVFGEFKPARAL